jgi:hypothetical protein
VAEGQGAAPGDTRDKIARYLGVGRHDHRACRSGGRRS